MNQLRDYDIIVWGASGFTGKLVAEYLFKKYGSNKNLKWAIAGRNSLKLNSVRKDILDSTVPLILADSNDSQSLNEMVKKTKVICTTRILSNFFKKRSPFSEISNINNITHCFMSITQTLITIIKFTSNDSLRNHRS